MRLMKNIFITVFFSLMCGCSQTEDYEILADRVINQTANQLEKEKDLSCSGTGGRMMGDIQAVGLEFQYFHLVNLEESRKLLVYAIQIFLKNINGNKEIRPYLHEYPFNTKNIEITIWIYQPDGYEPAPGNIQCVTLRSNTLLYKIATLNKSGDWPILHEETYEEALKVLAEKP